LGEVGAGLMMRREGAGAAANESVWMAMADYRQAGARLVISTVPNLS
jgi:hypothetical protein